MDGIKVPAGKMVVTIRGMATFRDIDTQADNKDGAGRQRMVPVLNPGEAVAFVVNAPPMIVPKGFRV